MKPNIALKTRVLLQILMIGLVLSGCNMPLKKADVPPAPTVIQVEPTARIEPTAMPEPPATSTCRNTAGASRHRCPGNHP